MFLNTNEFQHVGLPEGWALSPVPAQAFGIQHDVSVYE